MARITWLGHATVLIELGRTQLLTDPVLRRHVAHLVRVADEVPAPAGVDAVLLSHRHRDHLDLPTLRRFPGVAVIGPRGTGRLVRGAGLGPVRELAPGEAERVGALTVRATRAAHDGRRQPVGRRADALGFLIDGPSRIYFAGDTDLFEGMRELGDPPLDVALLPVAGWGPKVGPGHLDPERAAQAVALLRPRVAVPIHWGTYGAFGRRGGSDRARGEPARAFAALVARVAPEVDVVVLRPGESFGPPTR